jgi:BirA family biotin operon repressor/biotin-[acetyl-CoA-carboxylase] ligase
MQQLSIANPWKHSPVYYTESTGSTMDDALALGRAGAPGGTVVVTGYQRSGRGRLRERSWNSEPGQNLLFTLLLTAELSFPLQRLPVLAGLAVSRAVETLYGLKTEVKWPNDLLARGKKLAGILCQAHGPLRLVGVGLNCNQRLFPPALAADSCSLLQLLDSGPDGEIDTHQLLERILGEIKAVLGDGGWKQSLLDRLHGLGQTMTVRRSLPGSLGREISGCLEGIADDGALLLRPTGGDVIALASGEIRRI